MGFSFSPGSFNKVEKGFLTGNDVLMGQIYGGQDLEKRDNGSLVFGAKIIPDHKPDTVAHYRYIPGWELRCGSAPATSGDRYGSGSAHAPTPATSGDWYGSAPAPATSGDRYGSGSAHAPAPATSSDRYGSGSAHAPAPATSGDLHGSGSAHAPSICRQCGTVARKKRPKVCNL
jgi:hypothetical protein